MKNILAENMLRFGAKNLTSTSKQKLEQLAEQALVSAPVANTLKPYNKVKIDAAELFWSGGEKKSDATINVVPSADNKYYVISSVELTNAKGGNPYQFKFQKPLTFTIGQDDRLIYTWKPLIEATLKTADINTLSMYMNFPGGMTQTSGGSTQGKSIDQPAMVAFALATSIWDGLNQLKLVK